jgi:hypothetical protein
VQRRDLDETDRIFRAGFFRPELEFVAEPDGALRPVRGGRSFAAFLRRVVLFVLPPRLSESRLKPPLGAVVVVTLSSPAKDVVTIGC